MINVLYETGARPEEFRLFSKANFTNDYRTVTFTTKKQRQIVTYDLTMQTGAYVNAFLNTWGNCPTVWKTYDILKRDYLYNTQAIYSTASGHEAMYYLRYCYVASRMIEGYTEEQIKSLLGHLHIETTRIYMQKAQIIIDQM